MRSLHQALWGLRSPWPCRVRSALKRFPKRNIPAISAIPTRKTVAAKVSFIAAVPRPATTLPYSTSRC